MVSLSLLLFGCAKHPASFAETLARIEALGSKATIHDYSEAITLAGTSAERLRLLKRIRLAEPELAADAAALLGTSGMFPTVGLAVLDIFLNAGRFNDALGLFRSILPPEEFPLEFAETLLRVANTGRVLRLHGSEIPWLVLAYDATGRPELLEQGILQALEAGDTGTARLLLNESASRGLLKGTQAVFEVLWRYGFTDWILTLGAADSSYRALAVYADSAMLSGNRALATLVYTELIERYPAHSWRPYAALARLSGQTAPPEATDRLPLAATPPRGSPEAGYWYARMLNAFPDDHSAALEYSLWQAGQGSRDQLSVSSGLRGSDGDASYGVAALGLVSLEYLPLAAIELASKYPDSPVAIDAALAALYYTASWNRFLALNFHRQVDVPRAWFWDSASLALRGDFEAALQVVRQKSPMATGFESGFTLASYEYATGRYKDAALRFMIASEEAVSIPIKARCLVQAGNALLATGQPEAAARAYTAALGVDAFNGEALAALRKLPTR